MSATPATDVETLLRAGDLSEALSKVKSSIRQAPADPDLRFMLFQVLSACGDWEAASNQLVAFSELTGRQSPLAVIFNDVIGAEVMRKLVFQGEKVPVIFGEPPSWIPLLVQACGHFARTEFDAAVQLRSQAMEEVPAVTGTCNGAPFQWIMDGDSRLGPVFEIMMRGTYYWVPQNRVRQMTFSPPTHLRDRVWTAVEITFETGGISTAFMPVRYPGAHQWTDTARRLARSTDWESPADGIYIGSGQRVFMTDSAEIPLLDVREITFNPA